MKKLSQVRKLLVVIGIVVMGAIIVGLVSVSAGNPQESTNGLQLTEPRQAPIFRIGDSERK